MKNPSPKDLFVSPKEGISPIQSYDLGMGLEPSILFDREVSGFLGSIYETNLRGQVVFGIIGQVVIPLVILSLWTSRTQNQDGWKVDQIKFESYLLMRNSPYK